MGSLQESMNEFKKQLEKGTLQKAYLGLMDFMLGLKTYFDKKHPDYSASGALYHGFMDMTYFALFPDSLKQRNLKIAVVFNFEQFRFEVWLSGANKKVLAEYWKFFNESGWNKYPLIPPGKGVDFIMEQVLVGDPDFNDPDALTKEIESGTIRFIKDIEEFLMRG